MRERIWYMALCLGLLGMFAGGALAGMKKLTDPIIERRIVEKAIKPSLDRFFGPLSLDNDPVADRIKLDLGRDARGRKRSLTVFKGKKSKAVVATALSTSAPGYAGNIEVLTLFDLATKKILGVKTLRHSETKGLGMRVADDTEPFILQFAGMDASGRVRLSTNGGQVDAMSGATISSTAFTVAVDRAADMLREHAAKIQAP